MKPLFIESIENLGALELDYENMLALMPGHVYWKDRKSILRGCNNALANTLKLKSRKDIVGKTDYDISSNSDAEAIRTIDQEVMTKRIEQVNEESYTSPDGLQLIYLTQRTPIFNQDGEVIGLIGISFDITDKKKLESALILAKEAAEAGNQAKTEFLENMRHDIRTPLSGIVGYSEILKSESNEPRIKEYAENLIASSHALLDLMDEVLEAVRVSSGDIPMLKRKFNLAQTIERIVALYQARAHEKKLNLSLVIDNALPSFVIGDKIRLHRIALELIGNALNFTDVGHVSIHVTLAKKENRQLVVKMVVSDSGMGIPKEKQQEIYVQFKRLTPSYQGIYKGAGLGLFVVKQFIDELEGEIYVESEPHNGTVFTCLIPLKESLLDDASGIDDAKDLKTKKPYIAPPTQRQVVSQPIPEKNISRTVLVVEDNFIAQTVAKTLLSAMDCKVDVASNGTDAITLCEQHHYDLIFMDIGLGDEMDGYKVTNHIKNISNTPIIALTAHGGQENKQRCIEAGMDAVLIKPLTQAHATDIIKSFIPARHEASIAELSKTKRDLPDNNKELFQLNQFSLLDNEEALKNCGTLDMLKELLTLMTQELPADLDKMKNAFEQQDYILVEKTAHKIKGGAVYVGTTRMKFACQYLERYWKSGERELFEPLYLQAVSIIEDTCLYITSWLKQQDSE